MKRIRVEVTVPGRSNFAHEFEYCPMQKVITGINCPFGHDNCRFGLTEIKPTELCPMNLSSVKMKFSIINKK